MSARTRAAPVTFRCRGHAGLTGTHDKTLEFTRDRDVTRRATCVLGVDSDHDDAALLTLRGTVDVKISCAELTDTFSAEITPFFVGDGSLVFRRGPELRADTFAYGATKTAAGIDRALVRAIADPAAVVEVTLSECGRGYRAGVLFVVALPIGNDDDLSPRARRVLGAVDVVLAEDTRRFRALVRRTSLAFPGLVVSYHDYNEATRADEAAARLRDGARVALVSDAGTPLMSDPGYTVVRRALDEGAGVMPVPGPSASLAVLSASGLPLDRFVYAGFLPRRAAARQAELRRLVERRDTFVLHEAPHRVPAFLQDLATVAPEWQVCAGREVTKIFEEFHRGTARGLAAELAAVEPRGEYTFVVAPPSDDEIAGAASETPADESLDRFVRALLAQGVTAKTLAHALATQPGVSRKVAYARVLAIAEHE